MNDFQIGQRVTVLPTDYDCSPAWVGTIVNYWRNGCWTVREDTHGTTCAFDESRLVAS